MNAWNQPRLQPAGGAAITHSLQGPQVHSKEIRLMMYILYCLTSIMGYLPGSQGIRRCRPSSIHQG